MYPDRTSCSIVNNTIIADKMNDNSSSASASSTTATSADGTTTCGSRWFNEETKTLISLWGEENIQQQLDGAVRNKTIYEDIAKKMSNYGYKRDWTQCRNKIKNLKKEYRTVKDHNRETGKGRKTCRFFDELDDILGHRPASTPAVVVNTGQEQEKDQESQDTGQESQDNMGLDANDTYTASTQLQCL